MVQMTMLFAQSKKQIQKSEKYRTYEIATDTLTKLKTILSFSKVDYLPNKDLVDDFMDNVVANLHEGTDEYLYYNFVKGHLYRLQENYVNSVQYLSKVVEDSSKLSSVELIKVYAQLFKGYQASSNYGASLYYFNKLKGVRDTLDPKSVAYSDLVNYNINEENVFYRLGMYSEAISILRPKYFNEYVKENRDEYLLLGAANNLGLYYLQVEKMDSAAIFFRRSLSHLNKLDETDKRASVHLMALIKGNLGEAYYHLGNIDVAIRFLEEDVDYNSDYEPINVAWSSLLLVKCYLQKENFTKALSYLELYKTLDFDHAGYAKLDKEYYILLSEYYSARNNYKSSYEYLRKANRISDSLDEVKSSNSFIESKIAFIVSLKEDEIKNKEQELAALKLADVSENDIYEDLKNKYRNAFIGLVILAILVFISCIVVAKTNKHNKLLVKQNKEVDQHLLINTNKVEKLQEYYIDINRCVAIYINLLSEVFFDENKSVYKASAYKTRMSFLFTIQRILSVRGVDSVSINEVFGKVISAVWLEAKKPQVFITNIALSEYEFIAISMLIFELHKKYLGIPSNLEESSVQISIVNLDDSRKLTYVDKTISDDISFSEEEMYRNEMIKGLTKLMKGYHKITLKEGLNFELIF
ncbi:hypothetical protein Y10_15420 [Neptunitalea sp. Y10]|uniref:Tetratricopeptide repeat protein n=2 Tax=Neptunitalea lumnitzerae TaxID=2965509 RepID=A0ABQ5MIC8_9FLAO|nr:hypothetical protein Y10_15420 [Neptunitalea sp. Y10]